MPDATQLLAHVQHVLDALHCGALLIRRDGRIEHANPRFLELTSLAYGDVRHREVRTLGETDDDRRVIATIIEDFDKPRDAIVGYRHPDGGQRFFQTAGARLDCPELQGNYRIATILDVTELRRAEHRAREQYGAVTRLSDTVLDQALELKHHAETLETRVHERTRQLHEAYLEAVYMLAEASEARDADTGAHVRRIQNLSIALSRAIGFSPAEADHIGYSAILHDVGKMQVPDAILKKAGPLTPEERTEIEKHTLVGEQLLSRKPFFDLARQIARSHQENWDGSGYPDGLKGRAIPLAARIVRLVDVYDALTSRRVYKPSWTADEALAEIEAGSGTLFDPELVEAFVELARSGMLPTKGNG